MKDDQYIRTRRQLGDPALELLREAHVAVFGIGGVGGHAVEVLARSGVGELSLFDADTVALSNLNRQLVALHSTLGRYKVDVMADRIRDIDPDTVTHAHRLFYGPETADSVDVSQFDYVLDCIDTVTAKLLLIERCKAAGVPVLSSMGAANKLDPMAFKVSDIEKTSVCPLAKVIRKELRDRGIRDVKVLYSKEEPVRTGLRTPASVSFVPSVAGLIIAGEVIKDLTGWNGEASSNGKTISMAKTGAERGIEI